VDILTGQLLEAADLIVPDDPLSPLATKVITALQFGEEIMDDEDIVTVSDSEEIAEQKEVAEQKRSCRNRKKQVNKGRWPAVLWTQRKAEKKEKRKQGGI